uniref:Uncharacterized protein n=1 Tax=Rhizophora mucronata TaxID=61149 RepID=A0A2P2PND3_RHIMU
MISPNISKEPQGDMR